MSKRKAIIFGPLPPPYGGVSVYLSYLIRHLRVAGLDLRMWAVLGDRDSKAPNVRYIRHRRLGVIPALIREGSGSRILDATHFHLEYPHPLLLPVWLVLKFVLGFEWFKNVLDGSLPERYDRFGLVDRMLFRLAVRNVDQFIVVSEDLERWLRDMIGITRPVHVVPCLVPPPHGTDLPPRAEIENALSSWSSRPRRVCSIGVFIPTYGFLHAAEAVENLRRETGEDIGLALLDGTFAQDEEYRERVLKGRDWITVLENVPNPNVYEILGRSDCLVRGFGQESYGISRVEALWAGIPVVATTAGETRGMLTYEFGDVEALTSQIKKALFDKPSADIQYWSTQFRREADENVAVIQRLLMTDVI